ncbi:MAG TPA: RecX family transcriptional regulator [Gaiellaceae bacterium]
MATVTALHPERRDRVRVELDGAAWRTLPAAAVVAAGLRVGLPLDRDRARELGRAVRRSEALDAAGKALSHRDRSVAGLAAHLERKGVAPEARSGAVETLSKLGFVDDGRFAASRAASLARRGYGDEAIRFDLGEQGVGEEQIAIAVAGLEPELDRARALVANAGMTVKTARRLGAKGFSDETIESAITLDADQHHGVTYGDG